MVFPGGIFRVGDFYGLLELKIIAKSKFFVILSWKSNYFRTMFTSSVHFKVGSHWRPE